MSDLSAAFAHINAFVEQQIERDGSPGVALAITDREQLLHLYTRGFADLAAQTPITAETLFEFGSIGKSFTSIGLLQEHAAGRFDLHAPFVEYLPWFEVKSEQAAITAHHLLSHTAGIVTGAEQSPDPRYEVWALRNSVAVAPPGTYFHYSNHGYKALGLVLRRLAGQSYSQIIRERILDPIGMHASEPVITHEARRRMAVGYRQLYDDRPPHRSYPLVPATWIENDTADGCLAATPADLAAYLRMLLNRGAAPGGRVLSEESFALLTSRAIALDDGEEHFYGYALNTERVNGHIWIGHSGTMIGYYTDMQGDMDLGLGVVAFVNGPGDPGAMTRFALQTLRAALEAQPLPELPAPPPDPTIVERASDYTGVYRCGERAFSFVADGTRLILQYQGQRFVLEQRSPDVFYTPDPELGRFTIRFGRADNQVIELFYGYDWYTSERYSGPTTFEYPAEWNALPGHYRTHNPWMTNLRVVLHKGVLKLLWNGSFLEPLVPLGDGSFRPGTDERSPERVVFDTIVDGEALRMTFSGCPMFRFFTP